MKLFDKLKEPVFLKESSDAQRQLEVLKELEPKLTSEGQEKLRQDIKYLEYGIQGENQIAFELKNSHMAMYILHDIYLEDGDLSAQIDYLVVTRKLCFIIECKNLYGNIEINSSGDFIRSMEFGGRRRKEGIYSPITQNARHLELLKKLKTESSGNIISRFMTSRYFEDFYKSVVVLSNPKTVLNARYAKKEVRDKVIRADQLVAYIKEQCRLSKEEECSDERLKTWAESFLEFHKETEKNYTEKYYPYLIADDVVDGHMIEKVLEPAETVEPAAKSMVEIPAEIEAETAKESVGGQEGKTFPSENHLPEGQKNIEDTPLYKELKEFRLRRSREEQIKPYFIYNNSQLADLIERMPRNKQELQKVNGFGPVKAEKYGDEILEIISHHF